VDITVYLPDEIGTRAKAESLPLSRMLRDAVVQELNEREAMSNTLEKTEAHEVDLEDKNGEPYTGRITGVVIADDGDDVIYLTDDKRVIAYNNWRKSYDVLSDPEEELRGLPPGAYTDAMEALGIKVVIDL